MINYFESTHNDASLGGALLCVLRYCHKQFVDMGFVHVDDFKQEVVPLYVFALNGYFACVFKNKSAY